MVSYPMRTILALGAAVARYSPPPAVASSGRTAPPPPAVDVPRQPARPNAGADGGVGPRRRQRGRTPPARTATPSHRASPTRRRQPARRGIAQAGGPVGRRLEDRRRHAARTTPAAAAADPTSAASNERCGRLAGRLSRTARRTSSPRTSAAASCCLLAVTVYATAAGAADCAAEAAVRFQQPGELARRSAPCSSIRTRVDRQARRLSDRSATARSPRRSPATSTPAGTTVAAADRHRRASCKGNVTAVVGSRTRRWRRRRRRS